MDPWRIVKGGPSKTVDGKTWHWCPHHKRKGKYDGMYVTYPSDKHDEWMERKPIWDKKKSTSATSTSVSTTSTLTQILALSSDLKASMVVNFQCAHDETDKLWSDTV